ncbi:protease modulator HflC [soil metagenome]
MQKVLKYIVAALIVLAILAFMTTYSVRFTEKAVVTTFGKADENSVRTEPGMGFRWPYPIQSVVKYDTRQRLVQVLPQTIATRDERQIIISAYMTWRVNDPLKFYQLYGRGARPLDHLRDADDSLRGSLSAALSAISQYRLDELLNPDGGKLAEVEDLVKQRLITRASVTSANKALEDAGIELISTGISNIQMPEAITQAVFDAMKQKRTTIAANLVEAGKADSEAIRSEATAQARTIMEFVRQRAQVIRSQGEREAAAFYAQMNDEPELAVFLKSLDLLREGIGPRTTIVWPYGAPGMGVLNPQAAFTADSAPNFFPNLVEQPNSRSGAPAPKPAQPSSATPTNAPKERP